MEEERPTHEQRRSWGGAGMGGTTKTWTMAAVTILLLIALSGCGSSSRNQAEQISYCGQPTLGIVGENQTSVLDLSHGQSGVPTRMASSFRLHVASVPAAGPEVIVKVASGCTRGATVNFTTPGIIQVLAEDRTQDGRTAGLALTAVQPGKTTLEARTDNGTVHITFDVEGNTQNASPTHR